MAAACGLTIVKKFTYRGDASEEFSNQYWLTGGAPADSAAWLSLANAVIAQEKTCYTSAVSVVQAYGYADDAEHTPAIYSLDLHGAPVAGTLPDGTSLPTSGDTAVWLRWKTSRLNTKGKPIYLRKYFHGARVPASGSADAAYTTQKTALETFGGKMYDGTISGTRKITARAHTDTIVSHLASTYLTTRTLKRRGKRPGS